MSKVMIIGAGGVGRVVAHKCAQLPEIFSDIILASRTKSKCDVIAKSIQRPIQTAKVDADNVAELVELIQKYNPELIINVALPYQDLHIMDACLETKVHYLDTANYEPPDEARFCYKWQWDYHHKFKEKGIMALLGSGFDPGVTNVFTAYAKKNHFDRIDSLNIYDCNDGDHGQAFATNFNPEINIREITQNGRFYQDKQWIETPPMMYSKSFIFPEGIGNKKMYLLFHEELESLVKHFPEINSARFWMTFSDNYLNNLKVLESVGMTRIDPILYEGKEIVPLKFLKALLPDPSSLGPLTKGRTCIGCYIEGQKNGDYQKIFIYNICNHEDAYREVGSQAISYTTGVPAMIGAMMMLTKKWMKAGVYNMEQFDPDPFMNNLNTYGLPWNIIHY